MAAIFQPKHVGALKNKCAISREYTCVCKKIAQKVYSIKLYFVYICSMAMFVVYCHTKSYMPSSSGSLFIVIQPKAKKIIRTIIIFYSYFFIFFNKSCIFFYDMLLHTIDVYHNEFVGFFVRQFSTLE
jgi:hypothetical protein